MPRARTKARKRALDILFESEARGDDPRQVLVQRRETDDAPPVSDYAAMLVEGVVAPRDRIDQLLAEHAEGWTVARMPAVDRNLLRIAVFELLWVDEIDDPVAITEAVELARALSTDDSPRFLNGVLDGDSPYVFTLRLAGGQGLVCNNVLHNRGAFTDDPAPGRGRLVYRARYLDRVAEGAAR